MRSAMVARYVVQCGLIGVLAVWADRTLFRAHPPLAAPPPPALTPAPFPEAAPSHVAADFHWSRIESSSYPRFISNLRQIGCPEQTIRDIVIADLSQLYSTEWKRGLMAAKTNYWEAHFGCDPVLSDTNLMAAFGLQTNLQGVVRVLLGADLRKELKKYSDLSAITVDREILLASFLTPEKVLAAGMIQDRYEAMFQELDDQPFATAESVMKTRQLLDQQQQELAALLSAAELEQWNYRFSPIAGEIRGKIAEFDLSEAEFHALYAAQQRRKDELYAQIGGPAGAEPLGADALLGLIAATEVDEELLKNVLGASRFSEYERSRDVQYQQILQFARSQEMDAALVNPVYEHCARIEARISQIRDDQALSPEQKDSLIQGVRDTGDHALAGLLGPQHFEKFKSAMPFGP